MERALRWLNHELLDYNIIEFSQRLNQSGLNPSHSRPGNFGRSQNGNFDNNGRVERSLRWLNHKLLDYKFVEFSQRINSSMGNLLGRASRRMSSPDHLNVFLCVEMFVVHPPPPFPCFIFGCQQTQAYPTFWNPGHWEFWVFCAARHSPSRKKLLLTQDFQNYGTGITGV